MTPLRILLADDHALVRAGIRALLERMPGVEVVGEASDGLQALTLIEASEPDILLADIAMRGVGGIEATARTTRQFPRVKVIILSMYDNEEYVMQSLAAGAVGYLLKDDATVELELAITAVCRGENYFSPAISQAVVEGYLSRVSGATKRTVGPLTARQREILTLVANGQSTKEIAFTLGLSGKTVETHRAQIMLRLGISDVPGLVKYAMRTGLIPPAD